MANNTAEDLRAHVLGSSQLKRYGLQYFANTVPEAAPLPFIWARRARVVRDEPMGEPATVMAEYHDLEVVSDDLGQATEIADLVRESLEGTSGRIGEGRYGWVSVDDQFDDYVPRNQDADEQLHIVSLNVEVMR